MDRIITVTDDEIIIAPLAHDEDLPEPEPEPEPDGDPHVARALARLGLTLAELPF